MTIKSSGSLNTTEIVAEWGGSQPNSLSEYYSAGSLVYSGATDGSGNAIPSSGTISFSDFYDTTAFSTTSASSTTGTVAVPSGANAIYVITAIGGGGGGYHSSGSFTSGGSGASGEVVIKWATADATISGTRTGLTDGGVQTSGSNSYIVFTAGTGTVTFS